MTATVAEAICQSPLGVGAEPAVVTSLAALAKLETFPAGAELFREGDHHHQLYIVRQGHLSLDMTTATCGQQRILTAGVGDVVAWSALLGDGRMTATAQAIEETQMIVIDAGQLRSLCEADHDVGYRVMKWMARMIAGRLLATRLQLLDLFHP